jgi:hypothetical protein
MGVEGGRSQKIDHSHLKIQIRHIGRNRDHWSELDTPIGLAKSTSLPDLLKSRAVGSNRGSHLRHLLRRRPKTLDAIADDVSLLGGKPNGFGGVAEEEGGVFGGGEGWELEVGGEKGLASAAVLVQEGGEAAVGEVAGEEAEDEEDCQEEQENEGEAFEPAERRRIGSGVHGGR